MADGGTHPAPYPAQWDEFRRRRNLAWLAFAGYVPGVLALGIPLSRALHSELPVYAVAGLWMLAMLAAGMRVMNWRCPRCAMPFLRGAWLHNAFARRCLHCDLPKWSASDPGLRAPAAPPP